jgi:uncharacterized protein YjbI with pentapeptide repeats
MASRPHSWWKSANKPLLVVVMIAFLVALIVLVLGYWQKWSWTGFSTKTLWDWLQLLIVPIILAIGGFWLNHIQQAREQRITEQRAVLERELTRDNQQEALLQAHIDSMSDILLEKHLRESAEQDEVRKIARVRTITVLPRLNDQRKSSVLQFLYESGLLDRDKPVIDVTGADLSSADLSSASLHGANLAGVNLSCADLSSAHLGESNLSRADLSSAHLRSAYLSFADLRFAHLGGATMRRVDLHGANLEGADLHGANLRAADLGAANLSRADLSSAQLDIANLSAADLSAAILKDATGTTSEGLDEATSLQGTTMPDGSLHP